MRLSPWIGLVSWLAVAPLAVGLVACATDSARGGGGDDDDESGGAGGSGAQGGAGGAISQGGGGGAPAGGAGPGGGPAGMIPDPGPQMNGEWTDIEPNDLPSQAVPMGTLTGPMWAGFVMPYTAINPANDVDYFVFKTGPQASLMNVYMSLCWSFPGNLLDMNLYEVVNSTQGALAASATSTAAGCETLVDFGAGDTVLTADTTYLLEVVGAPGLNLGGDAGLYSA